MSTKVCEVPRNALLVQFKPFLWQATLPSLLAPRQSSVPVKSVAPELGARRERAKLNAEIRKSKEHTRQEQQQRMREQQVSRHATFKVD